MENNFDIIVVGAGHAGCEAAAAAANMGSRVLLVTMDMGKIAQMSCNPAMGGIAKGQIVREVDALGGYSGRVTDESTLQFRMLNRSKGPAMWSPRAQCDRSVFSATWRKLLENTPNISFWQDTVKSLLVENKKVVGVTTVLGALFRAKAVVLTNGTFLNGVIHVGKTQVSGGRMGDAASYGLSEQLRLLGFEVGRMKTGTPARLDGRTIDFSKLIRQDGDTPPGRFSYVVSHRLSQMGADVPRGTCRPSLRGGTTKQSVLSDDEVASSACRPPRNDASPSACNDGGGEVGGRHKIASSACRPPRNDASPSACNDGGVSGGGVRHCEELRGGTTKQDEAIRVASGVTPFAVAMTGIVSPSARNDGRRTSSLRGVQRRSNLNDGGGQLPCYIAHTSKKVHDILREGFADSPLFSGTIKGVGPRYCPSIEDKLRTFADKDSHQLFLEPEGWDTNEYYIQGFSSSLPMEVQFRAMREIEGLERVEFFRPGYAIEYDYFPPVQLRHSLETKLVENLYFAGQINGTTGYEEAAAQGLMAGANAHLKINGKPEWVLRRDQAYIGVLIDDLVTKGVDEPYRMFTSRAEYRILLRQDNADMRLTELSYTMGLAGTERYELLLQKKKAVDDLVDYIRNTSVKPEDVNPYLESIVSMPITQSRKLVDILMRPEVSLQSLVNAGLFHVEHVIARHCEELRGGTTKQDEAIQVTEIASSACRPPRNDASPSARNDEIVSRFVPRGRNDERLDWQPSLRGTARRNDEAGRSNPGCFRRHSVCRRNDEGGEVAGGRYEIASPSARNDEVLEAAEIAIKYSGYIERERALADKMLRLDNVKIPRDFDFDRLSSVSIEGRQKLKRYQPETIGQASRITGISPADVSVMLVFFGR